MTSRFMLSVAAVALIAGTGFANAQGTGMGREAPGSAAQQSQGAPSSERGGTSAAPMNRDSASEHKGAEQGMKATQSEEKMQPGASKNQRAQDEMKGAPKGEKSAQDNMKGDKSKGMSSENEKGAGKDMKAEGREGRDTGKNAQGREDRDTSKNAQGREGRDTKMNAETKTGGDRSQTTTGQAGAAAKLTTEQRTKITTVIRNERVAPANNVNFSISVGTRIPRDVSYHPLPAEVVTIYPEWRGYNYVRVRDQILVIDPATLEIVAVLDV